jgi:FkbM family methyltransferase
MSIVTYAYDVAVEYQRITEHYGIMQLPYGPMVVNMNDPAMGLLRESVGEIKELQQFVEGVVIDVGANVGSHSVNWAKKAQIIHAFEPHPNTFNNLCANLLLHMSRNVSPYQIALGAYNGDAMLDDFDLTQKHFSMGAFVGQVGEHSIKVPMRTIDSFNFAPVHFIKIDTEGGEYEVLKGANVTLQRESPIVFVEIHLTHLIEPIIEFMKERGYETLEFISYFMKDKDTGADIPLTRGQMFWKEGRIVWMKQ